MTSRVAPVDCGSVNSRHSTSVSCASIVCVALPLFKSCMRMFPVRSPEASCRPSGLTRSERMPFLSSEASFLSLLVAARNEVKFDVSQTQELRGRSTLTVGAARRVFLLAQTLQLGVGVEDLEQLLQLICDRVKCCLVVDLHVHVHSQCEPHRAVDVALVVGGWRQRLRDVPDADRVVCAARDERVVGQGHVVAQLGVRLQWQLKSNYGTR